MDDFAVDDLTPPDPRTMRVTTLLVREGFAVTERAAERLIEEGKVRLDEERVRDPAATVTLHCGPVCGGGFRLRVGTEERRLTWWSLEL